jgi:hypothetical protein
MFGEAIIARSISSAKIEDSHGNRWQYLSRSDRHSKVACWAILFDLLHTCSLLREHVVAGKVAFGINHEMRDFKQDRKKNLDLVLCALHGDEGAVTTFSEYGARWGIVLEPNERVVLDSLPTLKQAPVANVFAALEAKACMTEHSKALPRLHDELASSHQTIHGDTGSCIAAGFVMINCADAFVSSDRNRKRVRGGNFVVNRHKQPAVAEKTPPGRDEDPAAERREGERLRRTRSHDGALCERRLARRHRRCGEQRTARYRALWLVCPPHLAPLQHQVRVDLD